MSDNAEMEDRLESLGASLRARPRLTDRLMDDVRQIAESDEQPPTPGRPVSSRRRLQLLTAGTVAMVGTVVLIAIMLLPSQSVAWSDVAKAIRSKKWIRGMVTNSEGQRSTMWLSAEQQIWAYRTDTSHYFFNGREQAKYEYHGNKKPITKLPLGEDDLQRVLPVDALSQNKDAIGPWLFGEKIVRQQRRMISEDGAMWIEFQLVFWRGEMNQGTLRVDPKTRLPVSMIITSPTDKTKSIKWQFDYPDDGPPDIFALGVPRNLKINDRMPAKGALAVLDAIAKSRSHIGDFRMIVATSPGLMGNAVWRKGNYWRIDCCFPDRPDWLSAERPEDKDAKEWFEQQLRLVKQVPLLVCDGKTVWKNGNIRPGAEPHWQHSRFPAPQDLMSGEGLGNLSLARGVKFASLLFPDLSPRRGWGFQFDPQPKDAPSLVLLKRSAELATVDPMVGHEWYYVDPSKGHAVVRIELFNLPPDKPADPNASETRQTIVMEGLQQSPQGPMADVHPFWYPAVVHNTTPMLSDPKNPGKTKGQNKTTTRYHFDFATELPDSFFTIRDEPTR